MNDLLAISDGHLIGLSGISGFKSGFEYFQSGKVLDCTYTEGHISGVVSGGSLYAVKLRHTAKHVEGQCDCPESTEADFCKHCVALAMHYRRELAEHHTLASGNPLERIQAFINSMSKSELQEALLEIIEDDTNLLNLWSAQADLALNQIDSKLIRKRITAALPSNKRLYRRGQVKEFFYKVGAEVGLLEKQLPKLEAKKALQLLDYALQRLQRSLETIDDSQGYRLNLLDRLQRLHIATLRRSGWPPNRLVRYLEDLEASPAHDYYPQIPDDYTEALGDEGRELYLNNKQNQWDALPPLSFGADWEQLHPYFKIQSFLLRSARSHYNTGIEISLLEKTCVDLPMCLALCKRLLEIEHWEKLEFWIMKAKSWEQNRASASHLPNLELKRLRTQLLSQQGHSDDAVNLQWEVYQQSEIVGDYKQLIHFANLDDSEEVWKARVFRRLHKTIENPPSGHFVHRTLNHLVELYMLERQPEAALDLVNYHSLSYTALELLVKAFSAHSDIVYPLYQQQLNLLLNQANNHSYKEAVKLIVGCKKKLKTQDEHHFEALLETVRHEHSDKTTFQQLLNEVPI